MTTTDTLVKEELVFTGEDSPWPTSCSPSWVLSLIRTLAHMGTPEGGIALAKQRTSPVGKLAQGHFGAVRNLDELLDFAPAGVTSARRHD